jgi:ArsR family transcriptional regulator
LRLGDVLDVASGDGMHAELLAPQADRIVCLDLSRRVVDAGRERLSAVPNVEFRQGDMHALPFDEGAFDTVLLLHALTYTTEPGKVFAEAARVLRPGGTLVASTLGAHRHEKAVAPYDHVNLGFEAETLERLAGEAGLHDVACRVSAVEKRAPHFTVLSLIARKD